VPVNIFFLSFSYCDTFPWKYVIIYCAALCSVSNDSPVLCGVKRGEMSATNMTRFHCAFLTFDVLCESHIKQLLLNLIIPL